MAEIEELLQARLRTDPGVAALVGNRIHPDRLPQDSAYPAIRYVMLDRVEVLAKPGVVEPGERALRLMRARVQLDCYATRYGQAKAVAAAVKKTFYGWTDRGNGVIGARIVDEGDVNDEEDAMQRVGLDASITYNE